MIAITAGILLCGGCASSLYIAGQIEDRPAADLPCCNALHLDLELFREIRQGPDDYLLPPWLDRSLNMTALVIDLPFSLVFDAVTLPYQLLNAFHTETEEPAAHNTPSDNSL
ncbi:MAG: YceK/YidQ family lipoprotein [Victivallaceae bacterium]